MITTTIALATLTRKKGKIMAWDDEKGEGNGQMTVRSTGRRDGFDDPSTESPPGLRREVRALRNTADALEKVIENYQARFEPLMHHLPTDSYGMETNIKESDGSSEIVSSFAHETGRINASMGQLVNMLDRIQL